MFIQPHNINFPNLSQRTYFSGELVFTTITFSDSSELILWWQGLKMDGSLFFRFYSIWELQQKAPFNVPEGSTSKKYKSNFCRKHDQKNVIFINSTVLGNILKAKPKILQSDFPNSVGIYFSEYTVFLIIGKDPITKSSKYELK